MKNFKKILFLLLMIPVIGFSQVTITPTVNAGELEGIGAEGFVQTVDPLTVTSDGTSGQLMMFNGDGTLSPVTSAASMAVDISFGESYLNNVRSEVLDDGGTWYPNSTGYDYGYYKTTGIVNSIAQWTAPTASKIGVLYPVKGESFAWTRASTSTRVDADGYVVPIEVDEPRIDFTDGDGVIAPQDAATNLLTQPSSHSDWTKSGVTLEGDGSNLGTEELTNGSFTGGSTGWSLYGTSAYSTNAIIFTGNGTDNTNYISQSGLSTTLSTMYLVSYDVTANSLVGGAEGLKLLSGSSTWYSSHTALESAVGTHTIQVYSKESGTSTFFNIGLDEGCTSGTITIDNVSVKEVSPYPSPFKDSSGDVSLEAFKMVESNVDELHYMNGANTTIISGEIHDLSIYVKYNGRNIAIRETATTEKYLSVNLTTGLVIDESGLTSTIIEVVNGWCRIDFTYLSTSTTAKFQLVLLDDTYISGAPTSHTYLGDGTSGIYIAGANLVEDSEVTSYIPIHTLGSITTRLADVVTKTLTWTTDEGTILNKYDGVAYVYRYTSDGNKESFEDGVSQGTIVEALPVSVTLGYAEHYNYLTFDKALTDAQILLLN